MPSDTGSASTRYSLNVWPSWQEMARRRTVSQIIGDVVEAVAWNIQRRPGAGRGQQTDPPTALDYEKWLGRRARPHWNGRQASCPNAAIEFLGSPPD
jgi:hypothetical protein